MYKIIGLLMLLSCASCMKLIGAPEEDPAVPEQAERDTERFDDEEVLRKKLIALRKQDQAEQAQRIEQAAAQAEAASEPEATTEVDAADQVSEPTATDPADSDQAAQSESIENNDSAEAPKQDAVVEQLWVRVPFKSGFTSVDKKMAKALTDIAGKYLSEPRKQTLVVRGFCDGEPIGGFEGKKHKSIHGHKSQLALSKARAQGVANILIKAGISKDVVLVEGYGDAHFIADNDTVEGRDKNRRVDVFLISR